MVRVDAPKGDTLSRRLGGNEAIPAYAALYAREKTLDHSTVALDDQLVDFLGGRGMLGLLPKFAVAQKA